MRSVMPLSTCAASREVHESVDSPWNEGSTISTTPTTSTPLEERSGERSPGVDTVERLRWKGGCEACVFPQSNLNAVGTVLIKEADLGY